MNILEKMKAEWERTLLLGVFLVIGIGAGLIAYRLFTMEDGGVSSKEKRPTSPRYFDVTSYSYLEPAKLPDVMNPLAFTHSLRRRPAPPKPPPPKTEPKPDQKQPQQKPPVANTKPTPQPPKPGAEKPATPKVADKPPPPKPPPPKPKPPPRKLKVMYSGYSAVEGGTRKAWLRVVEEKGNKRASGRFEVGAQLLDAVKIESFDADKIVLIHSGGKKATIHKGKKNEQEITIQ
ncbi:MAG: hypothetical protein GX561_07630 [Lentisphaerae bacterium]|jgi:hypothetical protein|nr:hypothetical protein [Lentisphaerota bacterium]